MNLILLFVVLIMLSWKISTTFRLSRIAKSVVDVRNIRRFSKQISPDKAMANARFEIVLNHLKNDNIVEAFNEYKLTRDTCSYFNTAKLLLGYFHTKDHLEMCKEVFNGLNHTSVPVGNLALIRCHADNNDFQSALAALYDLLERNPTQANHRYFLPLFHLCRRNNDVEKFIELYIHTISLGLPPRSEQLIELMMMSKRALLHGCTPNIASRLEKLMLLSTADCPGLTSEAMSMVTRLTFAENIVTSSTINPNYEINRIVTKDDNNDDESILVMSPELLNTSNIVSDNSNDGFIIAKVNTLENIPDALTNDSESESATTVEGE